MTENYVEVRPRIDPGSQVVEDVGVAPVPAPQRTSGAADQFWIWAGANLAPIKTPTRRSPPE